MKYFIISLFHQDLAEFLIVMGTNSHGDRHLGMDVYD